MKILQQKILDTIDANANEHFTLLSDMIQEPSVQGAESNVQKLVQKKLESLGMLIDIWTPTIKDFADNPYFVTSRQNFEGSPNLVAILKGGGGGRSLLLNGHVDVVPEGDHAKWDLNPFSGQIIDGKIYGRGSTDMKGGNLAMMMALDTIVTNGIKLKGDVIFQSVVEEEAGGAGTLAACLRGYKADIALVPEPTQNQLFIKQQGSMWFRVIIHGRSAHGGTRYEGVSAIEKAILVVSALHELETIRNSNITDPLYSSNPIPFPINIGKLTSGNWPSSCPDLAILEGRIGVAPNENMEQVRTQLSEKLNQLNNQDEWLKDHPVELEFFGAHWLPNEVEPSHEMVKILQNHHQTIKNNTLPIKASPWGTDAGMLYHVANTPALVIGPGVTNLAHYPNEYIELQEIKDTAKIFALAILEWCGIAD